MIDGEAVLAGVSYGPYRAGQRPGGPFPSEDQIREDLGLIGARWHLIRVYGSGPPTEDVLRVIRDDDLPIRVVVGAWIARDADAANAAEVAQAIHLANAYPEQVVAVSVGNETQVAWSAHRSPVEPLIGWLREVRAHARQPVTTADDYNFWNKPESHLVADEVDFLLLHAYAMWNGQALGDAVPWTAAVVDAIRAEHPGLPIVLGETGWATELDPDGEERKFISGEASPTAQATFHRGFTAWTAEVGIPYFFFEAFDEPWKGGGGPRGVEKHWGLFDADRKPKVALEPE